MDKFKITSVTCNYIISFKALNEIALIHGVERHLNILNKWKSKPFINVGRLCTWESVCCKQWEGRLPSEFKSLPPASITHWFHTALYVALLTVLLTILFKLEWLLLTLALS